MKTIISFISGMAVCGLLILGARMVFPVSAATGDPEETSDNLSSGLLNLLPDIEMIYQESLTMPFKKAESKIYDEDIADYYRALMDKTGLAPQ